MSVEDSSPHDQQPESPRPYLTVKEAAHRLRRSPKTIRRWIKAGYLRAAKLKRCWLIAPDQIETLLSWYGKTFPYGIIIQRRWFPPSCPSCRALQDALWERIGERPRAPTTVA